MKIGNYINDLRYDKKGIICKVYRNVYEFIGLRNFSEADIRNGYGITDFNQKVVEYISEHDISDKGRKCYVTFSIFINECVELDLYRMGMPDHIKTL